MLQIMAEVQYALDQRAAAMSTLGKALAMAPENEEYKDLLAKWQGSAPSPLPVVRGGQNNSLQPLVTN